MDHEYFNLGVIGIGLIVYLFGILIFPPIGYLLTQPFKHPKAGYILFNRVVTFILLDMVMFSSFVFYSPDENNFYEYIKPSMAVYIFFMGGLTVGDWFSRKLHMSMHPGWYLKANKEFKNNPKTPGFPDDYPYWAMKYSMGFLIFFPIFWISLNFLIGPGKITTMAGGMILSQIILGLYNVDLLYDVIWPGVFVVATCGSVGISSIPTFFFWIFMRLFT